MLSGGIFKWLAIYSTVVITFFFLGVFFWQFERLNVKRREQLISPRIFFPHSKILINIR